MALFPSSSLAAQETEEQPARGETPASQDPAGQGAPETLAELIADIAARETAAETVSLEMETEGTFPDGSKFSSIGSIVARGRDTTRSTRRARFGDGLEVETDTVVTPQGIWMREQDPVQGELFTRMSAELMARLESARNFLGDDAGEAATTGSAVETPLGSSLLSALDRQFELSVRPPQTIQGQKYWVVSGPARALEEATDGPFGSRADHVDVLVRERDAAVMRMTHLAEGQEILEVRITRLELNPALGDDAFVMSVPEGVDAIDVLDHPPAAAQIRRTLDQARAKGWKDPAEAEPETAPIKDKNRVPADDEKPAESGASKRAAK